MIVYMLLKTCCFITWEITILSRFAKGNKKCLSLFFWITFVHILYTFLFYILRFLFPINWNIYHSFWKQLFRNNQIIWAKWIYLYKWCNSFYRNFQNYEYDFFPYVYVSITFFGILLYLVSLVGTQSPETRFIPIKKQQF